MKFSAEKYSEWLKTEPCGSPRFNDALTHCALEELKTELQAMEPITFQNRTRSIALDCEIQMRKNREPETSMPTIEPNICLVNVEDIIPTPDNPRRRIDPEKASFKELVESIKANGILQLPVGRPHPTLAGKIDLRAGHRRYAAGVAAGMKVIAMVIRELDDRTAMEVTVLENLQREDLTPMEEARGVRQLQLSGHDLEEIARNLGKSRQWVVRRGSLMDLIEEIAEIGEEHDWSAEALELFARYSPEAQREMVEEWRGRDWQFENNIAPGSVSYLRRYLADRQRELSVVPWKLDDAILVPTAGACNVCQHRTSCNPDLFDDVELGDADPEEDEKRLKGDRCLKVECWKAKRIAWVTREIESAKAVHQNLLLVKESYRNDDFPKAVEFFNVEKTKKSAEGAVPAMFVDGEHPGKLIWVKAPSRGDSSSAAVKAATAATKEAAESGDPEAAKKLLESKREAHEQRRWAWVNDHVMNAVTQSQEPTPASYKTHKGLVLLCAAFGVDAPFAKRSQLQGLTKDEAENDLDEEEDWHVGNPWDRLTYLTAGTANPSEWVWHALLKKIVESLRVHTVSEINEKKIEAVKFAAELVGLDALELKSQADVEIPEPKAWAKLVATSVAEVEEIDERLPEAQGKAPKKTVRAVKGKGAKSA